MLQLENLRPGEKVIKVLQRHWIIYVYLIIFFLIGIIISISLYSVLGISLFNNLLNIIFWCFFSIFIYMQWLNHELDMYIITDNRVIGVDQISFLNRHSSECNLSEVQEVDYKTKGILANILNYGTLSIHTASSKPSLTMDYCPNSMQEARKVLNIADEYKDSKYAKLRVATSKPNETK